MSKRANGEGTYFRRKDGRWQGQHSCRGPLGEPVRKTVYGKTQAEVRAKLRALEQQAAAGVVNAGRAVTLASFGEQWLNGKLRDDIRRVTWPKAREPTTATSGSPTSSRTSATSGSTPSRPVCSGRG